MDSFTKIGKLFLYVAIFVIAFVVILSKTTIEGLFKTFKKLSTSNMSYVNSHDIQL